MKQQKDDDEALIEKIVDDMNTDGQLFLSEL